MSNIPFINLLHLKGIGPEIQIEHGGTDFYNNYSTSYDLQYRYCPAKLTGPQPRTFNNYWKLPQQDYTLNYVSNITMKI